MCVLLNPPRLKRTNNTTFYWRRGERRKSTSVCVPVDITNINKKKHSKEQSENSAHNKQYEQ